MFGNLMKKEPPASAASTSSTTTPANATRQTAVPAVDIIERETVLELHADLPGVDQAGVEVTLDQGVLTIRGRTQQTTPTGFEPVHREYLPVDFERRFTVGEAIDGARISASISNGVLTLRLPKASAAQPKRIAVTAA
jgi:HSP20 family protein